MSNVDTAALHEVGAVTAESEQPATMAELLHRIAYGMEILPQPLAFEHRTYSNDQADIKLHIYDAADFEQWRQFCGAPEPTVGEWQPTGMSSGGATRRHETVATWRGHTILLLMVDHRWEPLTAEERRQQLADQLAALDDEIAKGVRG